MILCFQHVQLLTQTYVLCQNSEPEHATAGAASKMLLVSGVFISLSQSANFTTRKMYLFAGTDSLNLWCESRKK